MEYDAIIIGAGPAGIFAALKLAEATDLKILILDKGKDLAFRVRRTDILNGWGGAGAFSDGKLTLSSDVGGHLNGIIPEAALNNLLQEVDSMWLKYGAPSKTYGVDENAVKDIERKATLAGLKFIPSLIRHLGTDGCPPVLAAMREILKDRVHLCMNSSVSQIIMKNDIAMGVRLEDNSVIEAKYVIVAPGRSGADWLETEAQRLGIKTSTNPVDIGVRIEVPAPVLEHLTDVVYEPKLVYYSKSFEDKVRSFCVCPHGEVVVERHDGVTSVNGHSYSTMRTNNTNFALLVSTEFTEPFHEPITYGRYVASLANLLSGKVIVQRLGDLESGRRSTPRRIERGMVRPSLTSAVPGDLSFVLPYRHLAGLLEMLHAMDRIAPGVADRDTLLYGVEVKFYSTRITVSSCLETPIKNLFAIGDGAGITRSLMQASVSGVIAADEITRREGKSHGQENL